MKRNHFSEFVLNLGVIVAAFFHPARWKRMPFYFAGLFRAVTPTPSSSSEHLSSP